ncbi:SusD/RagB family nutrient-binding outer membrane lipoprotein [Mucilaginibacter pocheonensis]|uniref:Starch-binding associating with outer membrane n=1 Tax=Mucilaginibacter pocheonensis TaxID=398050 RepID=A0ABU1TFZ1_9SPHI|nr:SusD/RagB family nutrient-binding outer membrane lipoprotein [Mucilaginibacter pocheonensis]MDR6944317.1 hypothetical protein [Mucilaginibacter pocheonensis]
MKKIYIYTLASAFILSSAGCSKLKDFGNVNNDPGNTTKPITAALLTNVQADLAGFASTKQEAINGGQYAQYFTETQYSGTSLYNLPQNSFANDYSTNTNDKQNSGSLNNLQIIINLNESKNTTAVAKILQQYLYWVITDSWGDVPYSEALKGSAVVTPKYDTQEDIYKGIIATLTSASGEFDSSSTLAGDIIYGGDVASWKRMANSLKLLAAIQLSNRVPSATGYAATAVKEAIAAGVITDNSQNFVLNYPGGVFKSAWWSLYNGRKDFAEAKTLTDVTAATNDPRQAAFGGASEQPGNIATSNIGVPYGLVRLSVLDFTDKNPTWARVLRGDLRTESGSVMLISAAEVWLARAEAANLGWIPESIVTDYNTGITASFAQWGAGTPSAAYLAQFPVTNTPNADITGTQVKNISTQRWISSYPDGHAAWAIWRKTGWPKLTPAPDATNASKQIVRRFTYATSEYNTNGTNVKAAVARIAGGDTQDAHVWWDTRTTN